MILLPMEGVPGKVFFKLWARLAVALIKHCSTRSPFALHSLRSSDEHNFPSKQAEPGKGLSCFTVPSRLVLTTAVRYLGSARLGAQDSEAVPDLEAGARGLKTVYSR